MKRSSATLRLYLAAFVVSLNAVRGFQALRVGRSVAQRRPARLTSAITFSTRTRPARSTVVASLSAPELEMATWVAAFSGTHIGLSAVRDPLIEAFGSGAGRLGAVGRDWTVPFPEYWLGDASGSQVWPDEAAAGRQIFRAFYTLVAAATLGGAFGTFAASRLGSAPFVPDAIAGDPSYRIALFVVAVVSLAVSFASLLNPSPLSLVPGFAADSAAPLALRRDDTLKLRPYGLTRITRHPLILPVVPWGLANAVLAGGSVADAILFGGLALYALAGCYAQDGRAAASAEVGTVFARGDLTQFYATTSFAPFGALADGRQRWDGVVAELNWSLLASGLAIGCASEAATLHWLDAGVLF